MVAEHSSLKLPVLETADPRRSHRASWTRTPPTMSKRSPGSSSRCRTETKPVTPEKINQETEHIKPNETEHIKIPQNPYTDRVVDVESAYARKEGNPTVEFGWNLAQTQIPTTNARNPKTPNSTDRGWKFVPHTQSFFLHAGLFCVNTTRSELRDKMIFGRSTWCQMLALDTCSWRANEMVDPSGERIRKGTTAKEQVVKRRKNSQHGYEDSEKNIEKLNPKSQRKRS